MVVPILLGIITLIGVVFLALSRKSSIVVRMTALIALGLMVITVIICLLIGFGVIGNAGPRVVVLPDAELYDTPPPAPGPNVMMLVMFIIFLVALFVVVLVMSLKERQRGQKPKDDW